MRIIVVDAQERRFLSYSLVHNLRRNQFSSQEAAHSRRMSLSSSLSFGCAVFSLLSVVFFFLSDFVYVPPLVALGPGNLTANGHWPGLAKVGGETCRMRGHRKRGGIVE
jgi:hypothetical protein